MAGSVPSSRAYHDVFLWSQAIYQRAQGHLRDMCMDTDSDTFMDLFEVCASWSPVLLLCKASMS